MPTLFQDSGWLGPMLPTPTGPAALLYSPIEGDTFEADETLIIHAQIPGGAPAVTRVDFTIDGVTVGQATASPWEYQAAGVASGAHTVRAKAIYVGGGEGLSAPASVTVAAARAFDIAANAKVKAWLDASHNASITTVSGRVSAAMRYRDAAVITSDFAQSTSTARPVLGKVRGKQAFFFGTGTAEELIATVSGTIAFPATLFISVRPVSNNSTGVVLKTAGISRISYAGNTGYPRSRRFAAGVQVTSSLVSSVTELLEFLINQTSSETRRNGVTLNGPGVNTGNSGISTNLVIGTEAMSVLDVVLVVGALTTQERADITGELHAKSHADEPTLGYLQLGDSITNGFASTSGAGFRLPLFDEHTGNGKYAGFWIEAVGSQHSKIFSDDAHCGINNKGINYWLASLPTLASQLTPDIVDVMIGVNNVASVTGETYVAGTGAGSTLEAYKQLLLDINAFWPAAALGVTPITASSVADHQTNKLAFNAGLPAIWAEVESTRGIEIVRYDADDAMGGPSHVPAYFADSVHPNDIGYARIAKAKVPMLARCAHRYAFP